METVGPLSSTQDGLYIAGGAVSGNAYVWEVSSGRLLKTWSAHHKSLNCRAISDDNSLLVSGSDDGFIRVWQFKFSIGIRSLDGTCKVWDIVSGKHLQSLSFPLAVTAIVLDAGDQLFSGMADGRLFVDMLDIGLGEKSASDSEDHMMVFNGHKGSITALTFSSSGSLLISASEDCTVCLWDVSCWVAIQRFNHQKGKITNMVVIPQSSLLPLLENHQNVSYRLRVSVLEKYPQSTSDSRGPVTRLPTCCSLENSLINSGFRSTDSMSKQILDLEQGQTLSALQMKVQTNIENRMQAASMTKDVREINKQLRSRLLDFMHCRLSPSLEFPTSEKRKKIKFNIPPQPAEE